MPDGMPRHEATLRAAAGGRRARAAAAVRRGRPRDEACVTNTSEPSLVMLTNCTILGLGHVPR